jgi:hypothetical protein
MPIVNYAKHFVLDSLFDLYELIVRRGAIFGQLIIHFGKTTDNRDYLITEDNTIYISTHRSGCEFYEISEEDLVIELL